LAGFLKTHRNTISLDFLEARRRTKHKPLQMKKLAFSIGVAATILVFITEWIIHKQTTADTQMLRGQLSTLTNSLSLARDEQQKSLDTLNSIQTLNASTEALIQERQQLEGQGQLDHILRTIVENLPQGTNIQQTKTDPQEIVLEGEALQYSDIINYIHALEHSGLFTDIRITSMQQSTSDNQITVCSFQLNIQR
jgi:Tfp pilus assembly protein PilN